MDFISGSIRNKLLVICGGGTAALLLAAVVGMAVEWSAIDALSAGLNQAQAMAIRDATESRLVIVGIVFAAVVGLAFFAFLWALQRSIIGPAKQLSADLERLARGEFHMPVLSTTRDELGTIAQSAERIRCDLGLLMSQLKQSAQSLVDASHTVSGESHRVAEASSEQSRAASSTAASIEDVTAGIHSVSSNAGNATQRAEETLERSNLAQTHLTDLRESISRTATVINEVAGAANAFVDNAQRITQMTSEVREIAEQTNLLALNAAIEAARAGEQGRGFAVVADEVRKLAEKSARSAGAIDAITHTLSERASSLSEALTQGLDAIGVAERSSGSAADVIAAANQAVTVAAGEVRSINDALGQQSKAASDIANHVEHIADMSGQNQLAVANLASSVTHLQDLAQNLNGLTEKFRL